jgi:hypothetical protein
MGDAFATLGALSIAAACGCAQVRVALRATGEAFGNYAKCEAICFYKYEEKFTPLMTSLPLGGVPGGNLTVRGTPPRPSPAPGARPYPGAGPLLAPRKLPSFLPTPRPCWSVLTGWDGLGMGHRGYFKGYGRTPNAGDIEIKINGVQAEMDYDTDQVLFSNSGVFNTVQATYV